MLGDKCTKAITQLLFLDTIPDALNNHLYANLFLANDKYQFLFFFSLFRLSSTAPSPVTVIRKDRTSRNSIALSWQEPEHPNGIILDYEVKYYEKVGRMAITAGFNEYYCSVQE